MEYLRDWTLPRLSRVPGYATEIRSWVEQGVPEQQEFTRSGAIQVSLDLSISCEGSLLGS